MITVRKFEVEHIQYGTSMEDYGAEQNRVVQNRAVQNRAV